VCRGVVANSGRSRFCTKIGCVIKSHQGSKVDLEEGNLYIRGSRKDQALLQPMLRTDALPPGMEPSVLAASWKPVSVWRAYFEAEQDRKPPEGKVSTDSSWEEVESPTLAKFSDVESKNKTPKKLKVGTLLEVLVETMPIGIGKAEEIGTIVDPNNLDPGDKRESAQEAAIHTALAEWNKVSACVDLFDSEFVKLGGNESNYQDGILATVLRIHEAIRDTDARAALLGSRMGHDESEALGQGDESVWDSMRRLCDAIDKVQAQADSGAREIPSLVERSDDTADKLEILSQNFHGLRKYAQDGIHVITQRIRGLWRGRTL
jgi:hypothetical protein